MQAAPLFTALESARARSTNPPTFIPHPALPPAAAAAPPPPAAPAPAPGLARRFLGVLARPWSEGSDMGTTLSMMSTQADNGLAAGNSAYTYGATQAGLQRTQSASYGWYGMDGRWRRH